MGITSITAGTGLTGGTITDTGTIALATIPGVAGTWENPTSITVNAQGQIIAITGVADTTAPIISAITATSITSTGATITWTTDDPSDSQVEYSTDTSYSSSTTLDTAIVTSHSVAITGTAPAMPYHYRVKSRNTAGLLTTSGDNTFTTVTGPDVTPPVITINPISGLTDVSVTINWTTDEASDSQVDYSADPDTSYGTSTPITNPVPPGVTTHAVTLTGLTPSQLYHARVKSKDAAGNPAVPVLGTFTTAAPPAPALLTSLVAYWKLDETGASANRVDSVGSNTLIAASAVNAVAGKFGDALQFVGDLHYLNCASNATLAMGASVDYTIAAWVQIADKGADRNPFGKGAGVADEYILGYSQTSDRIGFTVQGVSGGYHTVYAAPLGAPAVNTWYLVVMWHDAAGATINIQINNTASNSASQEEPPKIGTDPLVLGCYAGIASAWFGLIDEMAIWKNRLLSPSDVLWLWNGGAGRDFTTWT